MIKVKICGLRREEDVRIVNETKPDYIGFVFALRKREISDETAARLAKLLDPEIQKVGVFVDAPKERVIRLLNEGVIDLAQLHGNEDEAYAAFVREATGKPVIKALELRPEETDSNLPTKSGLSDDSLRENVKTAVLPDFRAADYLLLDSGKGSGRKFAWERIPTVEQIGKPYFLAGGLSPENVTEALMTLSDRLPYAVDVSSGVETDGYKDAGKVRDLIARVRSWQV